VKVWLNTYSKPPSFDVEPERGIGFDLVVPGVYPGISFFASEAEATAARAQPEAVKWDTAHNVKFLACVEVDLPDGLGNG
jgi:hypothetical protein